jgi:exodeoxyribonuclease-3
VKLVTWNLNSIRARTDRLLAWLDRERPDVLCMQETKVEDAAFPLEPLRARGYEVAVFGQRSYNGVAIASTQPLADVTRGFGDGPHDDDDDARTIAATTHGVRVVCVYVPNGQELTSDRYPYKLDWLRRLRSFLDEHYDPNEKLVVCGDFNITFDDRDMRDPQKWHEKILCSTPERDALRTVMDFGLFDALRKHHEEAGIYTWWDMRTGAFRRDDGLRIDHFLVSQAALDACTDVVVDRDARDGATPSDHAPVIATFA